MFYCMPLSLKYVCYSLSTISQQSHLPAKKKDTTSSVFLGREVIEPEASDPNHARYQTLPHPDELFIYIIDRSHFPCCQVFLFLFLLQKICAFLDKNRVGYTVKLKTMKGKKIGFSSESWRLVQDSRKRSNG